MNFFKKNKTAIGGGVVLILLVWAYFSFFSGTSTPTLTTSDTTTPLSQQLLTTLQNLKSIKLDNAIFATPAFQSLTDFGVTLPKGAYGRRNPFLPLGGIIQTGSTGPTITAP